MSVSLLLLVLSVLFSLCVGSTKGAVSSKRQTWAQLPANSSFALLAWGDAQPQDSTSGVAVVDVDIDTQKHLIPGLKAGGATVICYFSVGSSESWRPDVKNATLAPKWKEACIAKMDGWNECWLDIRNLPLLQELQGPRFLRAVQEGCDGLEPDNIDCYANSECLDALGVGKEAAKELQIKFDTWQINYAHSLGLSIVMKNALGLMNDLGSMYDGYVNEQCVQYGECDPYAAPVQANKLVMHVEYTNDQACSKYSNIGMMTKWCPGSSDDGDCDNQGPWTNCF